MPLSIVGWRVGTMPGSACTRSSPRYTCAPWRTGARRNAIAAITDESALHTALNGWDTGTLARALLDGMPGGTEGLGSPDEVGRVFTLLAVTAVLPRDLASIPVEKIVAAREKLLPSMYAYRQYLESFAGRFAELAAVGDPGIVREHLDILVRGDIEPRVAELEGCGSRHDRNFRFHVARFRRFLTFGCIGVFRT
jgi:hypothetical protein